MLLIIATIVMLYVRRSWQKGKDDVNFLFDVLSWSVP